MPGLVLGGRPWGSFWLPRPPRTKKEARRAKCVRLGAPIWGSIFGIFRYFSMFFCVLFSSLHFGGFQDRILMDFGRFVGSFLEVVFIIFRIVGKYGKCHSDTVFTMFEAHRPLEKEQKKSRFQILFWTFFPR